MSRDQIQKKLKNLEAQKAPEPKMGAMCYSPIGSPERAEYVCPKCGEKTLYANDNVEFVALELEDCRREFDILKRSTNISLVLDESSYCGHCSPEATKHSLVLTVTYEDGSTHTNTSITHYDLRLLRDFLKGQLSYETFNEGSEPLKSKLPRLRQLLGFKSSKSGPQKRKHD